MIWCLEDDARIRELELYALHSAGLAARGFAAAAEFWAALAKERPALIILDVMLPGEDGISVLKRLKSAAKGRQIPVIMATARGEEYDRILGLELGADDYLVKPFSVMEMVARVKAVLRRCAPEAEAAPMLGSGSLVVRPLERLALLEGDRLSLTYKEFELLLLFLRHPGRAFTREQIFAAVWGEPYCGETRTVDIHIRTLRQKLGAYAAHIVTVRHVGYRWEESL